MFKRKVLILLIAVSVIFLSSSASARDWRSDGDGKYSAGLQSSFMSYGPSGKIHLNDKLTLQGIIGALGTLTSFSARGLYKFVDFEPHWNMYGFGQLGVWTYSGISNETVFGYGGGVGMEWGLRNIRESMPPVSFSVEAGFGVINFDDYTGFSTFNLGSGVHYRF
ncbi:MAG TPA: hypothetical protein ENJ84_01330 [Gammaproteobacteria bacterium]|nr:hypothetical protein [Gammaproteobacteria bacterium]